MPLRTEVEISDGKYTVNAIFHKREAKGIYPGVAAYRMDRLLELDMVPVTVKREIKGSDGSLQFMPDNRMDETSRSLSGQVGSSSSCSITDQWAAMYVFDVLVYNEGRSQQRMLYDKSSWRLMLSEHERTFANKKGRPSHLKKVSLAVNDGWKNALTEMTDQVLQDNYLSKHEEPEEIEYYFCGPPLMNAAVIRMLDELGVPEENISFDDFGG